MLKETLNNIISIIHLSERLKQELRHSWLSNGRRESVAEHTWRVALIALFLEPLIEADLDITKVLKMIIIHDLPEVLVGDIPAFDTDGDMDRKEKKAQEELEAIQQIGSKLGTEIGTEIVELWCEYEEKKTPEAIFAAAIDKLEAQIQHNEAPLDTWLDWEKERLVNGSLDRYCAHSQVLKAFLEEVRSEGLLKLRGDASFSLE